MSSFSTSTISDINAISEFLASEDISTLHGCPPVDVLVFCVSAVLPIAHEVFSALETTQPKLAKTVVICGGIGHSTRLLYEAVRKNPKYQSIADQIDGLPEAAILNKILKNFYPRLVDQIEAGAFKLLIEDKSTNCGANASETRKLLDQHFIPLPKSVIIVQDPTMSLRTIASFRKTYADVSPTPKFQGCPTFVPLMALDEGSSEPHFQTSAAYQELELWDHQRFFDLIMGEIPRLRDDENGYGPKGKGFIAHVDVPGDIDAAWTRLRTILDFKR
ncbi:hypothetical protein LTR99_000875 [Exophiala xenobiotica]|uniref:DUF218 domain-containing protein n=1 Tax=Vermiconidia calcicola TaxID=1690605 RepID=A0AAV9QLC0_9PEZI|nr:hypothetical protein LTR96_000470 [Exophiala xenobiotica]KAK5540781.1 hypothetical protein LTR23_006012 [Chaetothyriales sp. CCFEE 6169]KAK5545438.1 hypothetical protein LTR25_000445 [Vermiconidia calcicola]KAK5307903.1 hypothetical protein LTR99_000875 [Exophiala xenobiotica]KAK5343200.1 hypothetical protein LTR98_000829 [Exophiala xenobiotica]